jgi:CubicO group peptidase (beta-lactamase class C family)
MWNLDRRHCIGLIGSLAVAPISIPAFARAAADPVAERLDARMREAEAFGFSGQIFAARRGTVLLDKAYGWADRARGRRMTRDTPIGIASATKQFSAAAVMRLREKGLLRLDEPIGRYLTDAPADKAALTLDQVMSHTSGLTPGDLSEDFALDKAGVLQSVYASRLLPAGPWRYSNAGYNLVAALIESVSGQAYEDFLTDALFRPAGMRRTGFPKHRSLAGLAPSHAYRAWLDKGSPESWARLNFRPWGGGTALSTAGDLYRWQQALESHRILGRESVAGLIAPHARPDPENTKLGYAYGAFVENGEHGLFIERSGDWERGYNAAWHRWPEEDMTLIILSNGVTASGVSMRQMVQEALEQIMRGETPSPQQSPGRPLPGSARHALAGDYPLPDGAVTLIDDGAYLWATARGQSAVDLLQPPSSPEVGEGLRLAVAKSETLFSGLKAGNAQAAFAAALTESGAAAIPDYLGEWSGFVEQWGLLESYDVLGASERGRTARVLVVMRFARRQTVMDLAWRDGGRGRLGGTSAQDVPPSVAAYVVAPSTQAGSMVSRLRPAFTILPGAKPGLRFGEGSAATTLTHA